MYICSLISILAYQLRAIVWLLYWLIRRKYGNSQPRIPNLPFRSWGRGQFAYMPLVADSWKHNIQQKRIYERKARHDSEYTTTEPPRNFFGHHYWRMVVNPVMLR